MSLPIKTTFKGTGFGINKRELVFVATGFILMTLILAVPFTGILARIILGFAVMGGILIYAFWRIHGHWTIEAWCWQKIRHKASIKRFIKGYSGAEEAEQGSFAVSQSADQFTPERAEPLFNLPSWLTPRSNAELLGYVLSTFSLVVFLSWVGTSGVQEIHWQFGELLTGLW